MTSAAVLVCSTAHPRSRGENANFLGGVVSSPGSSPLTRGKLHARDQGTRDPGLIPAHAGKTDASQQSRRKWRAHPRSRGENATSSASSNSIPGSSPLTRGKHSQCDEMRPEAGLIPAHAGKTRRAW